MLGLNPTDQEVVDMPNYIAKYFLILLILANPGYLQGWLDLLP